MLQGMMSCLRSSREAFLPRSSRTVPLIENSFIFLKLNNATTENEGTVYVKLEYFNPGSSVKDRLALAMVEAAEKVKELAIICKKANGNAQSDEFRKYNGLFWELYDAALEFESAERLKENRERRA